MLVLPPMLPVIVSVDKRGRPGRLKNWWTAVRAALSPLNGRSMHWGGLWMKPCWSQGTARLASHPRQRRLELLVGC